MYKNIFEKIMRWLKGPISINGIWDQKEVELKIKYG
jgi:hypothetical protein